jgi:hypothetical protein
LSDRVARRAAVKAFLALAGLIAFAVIGYPFVNEQTTSAFQAVEHRFMNLTQQTQSGDPMSSALATALIDSISNGEIATALIKQKHPYLPPVAGCIIVYWQLVLEPNTLRPARTKQISQATPESQASERSRPLPPVAASQQSPNNEVPQANGTHDGVSALVNTLERLRSLSRGKEPAGHRAGNDPIDNNEAVLSAAQSGAIGDYVRRCWSTDPGMLDLDKMHVRLTITADANGIARRVSVAPEDQGQVAASLRLRVFSERATRAVLSPDCANLPIPAAMMGQAHTFTILFKP